ncbi:MAG: hypothetical protein AB1512_32020 [Thermodesulfobacteriota bacterium]
MAKVLPFHEQSGQTPDNLITRKPWEFRRPDWDSVHFIQMLKSQARKLEQHRREVHQKGGTGVWQLPPHFVLRGGMASTVHAIFRYRENEERMREVYYLAGLVDCMIHRVSPILRTGCLKDVYRKTLTLRSLLDVNWQGTLDHVLLPLDSLFFNDVEYRATLLRAGTLKDLFRSIREGTDEMFDILALEYSFYTHGRGR